MRTLLLICFLARFASAQDAMTNDAVIRMVQAGVPAATIIRTIAVSPRDFRFSPADLQALAAANVPDEVVRAMAGTKPPTQPAPSLPATKPKNDSNAYANARCEPDNPSSLILQNIDA